MALRPGGHKRVLSDCQDEAGNQEAKSGMPGKSKERWTDPPGRIKRCLSESPQQEEQCPDGDKLVSGRNSKQEVCGAQHILR
ncbi:hypothetical protein CRENBAI_010725 [Crenichthys baileyi]|uniref:Uncharacterized protein n=1 Tax=Crenichthys baileyi TaxID=28760 RepID=A0AAV9RSA6_9TELE